MVAPSGQQRSASATLWLHPREDVVWLSPAICSGGGIPSRDVGRRDRRSVPRLGHIEEIGDAQGVTPKAPPALAVPEIQVLC